MRLGNLDELFVELYRNANPFDDRPAVHPSVVWSAAATIARTVPTIDPETLPIVRQLREELARVTAERDAAVADLRWLVPAWKWDGQKEEMKSEDD